MKANKNYSYNELNNLYYIIEKYKIIKSTQMCAEIKLSYILFIITLKNF